MSNNPSRVVRGGSFGNSTLYARAAARYYIYDHPGYRDYIIGFRVVLKKLNALRAVRGGSWVDGARYCRSGGRYAFGPGSRSFSLGFRLVLKPTDQ